MKSNSLNRDTMLKKILREWQNILNETAEFLEVPPGLITRTNGDDIEILFSSKNIDNTYPETFKDKVTESEWSYDSKNKCLYFIPRKNFARRNNKKVELKMIPYSGLPIKLPNDEKFGTLYFLDIKDNENNKIHIMLINQVKRMVEFSLRYIYLEDKIDNRNLQIEGLSLYPICSYCKKVKSSTGEWISIERFMSDFFGVDFSHGLCSQCFIKEKEKLKNGI